MRLSTAEIAMCAEWARANSGEDDPIDVMVWKLLEVGLEGSTRSANYHAREVAEATADVAHLSSKFYASEGPEPNGDEDIEF